LDNQSMARTWRTLSGDRLQGRTRAYDCPAGYRNHLVCAVRSEAADNRCKSYRTVGFQSNNYGQQFEINRRGLKQWPTASRVTLATSYCYPPRSSGLEARVPTCASRPARVERPVFGRRLQQSPRLSVCSTHRTKPLGGMRQNLTTDKLNLARGSRGIGSHDRRGLRLVTGVDHLRVVVLLRGCRNWAASRVVLAAKKSRTLTKTPFSQEMSLCLTARRFHE
jgi:hypothetical protein